MPNRFQARVEEFIYLGDHLRIRLALAGNDQFVARVPVTEFQSSMRPGDLIEIGWRDEDVRALDAP
ncbi:TOBE domain-containing protein [Halomonas alkalicola]|uniref:TOBE domain-containing protein n=1 Tax=Halomonas alkalicola TaxID=1930622 RepID=UPI00345B8569